MKTLTVRDPRAAFVDVGSEHMHVSVAGDEPAVFGAVTSQLHALRDWVKSQGVRSAAMEATGVYWLPLYGVLEAAGFEVHMVNGRQTRNLPGRKTDMQDCQWGATLHMHGLLRASCRRPTSAVCRTTCDCGPTMWPAPPAMCSTCKRRSNA
ncbi:IS110 family transposase [Paraburkholderia elongata]|uniref:Transposase n=1 Tax=Paraburkholderia elongata TaxID=2675747 RepID=A0A972NSU6_9BURK|nr:transposase [Paraburkholderia elongata]NPT58327.1 transposase [Paraburkholderia elongata]